MKRKVRIELNDSGRKILSAREEIIILCLLNGYTVTEIAKFSCRDVRTISTQKINAYKKLGVKSDTSLLIDMLKNSYIEIKESSEFLPE
ncbi:LuxR C-terminal-related transcriptional regulator [Escherichia coli]